MTDLDKAPSRHYQSRTMWSHEVFSEPCIDGMTALQAYRAYIGYLVHKTGYNYAFNKISVDTADWQAVLMPYALSVIQNIYCDLSDHIHVEAFLRKHGLNAYSWEIDAYLNSKQKFMTPMQSPALQPISAAVPEQMPEAPALEKPQIVSADGPIWKKKSKVRVVKN